MGVFPVGPPADPPWASGHLEASQGAGGGERRRGVKHGPLTRARASGPAAVIPPGRERGKQEEELTTGASPRGWMQGRGHPVCWQVWSQATAVLLPTLRGTSDLWWRRADTPGTADGSMG